MGQKCPECGHVQLRAPCKWIRSNELEIRGKRFFFSPSETTMLRAILNAYPDMASNNKIINEIWGSQHDGGPVSARKQLQVFAYRIRQELKGYASVHGRWGHGYYAVFDKTV